MKEQSNWQLNVMLTRSVNAENEERSNIRVRVGGGFREQPEVAPGNHLLPWTMRKCHSHVPYQKLGFPSELIEVESVSYQFQVCDIYGYDNKICKWHVQGLRRAWGGKGTNGHGHLWCKCTFRVPKWKVA